VIVLGLFAVGVALWGLAGWDRVWKLFAPYSHEYRYFDPFDHR
jgi:hypothetical protein